MIAHAGGMGVEGPGVFEFFVGDEQQGAKDRCVADPGQFVEDVGEGSLEGAGFEGCVAVECGGSAALCVRLASGATEGGMGEGEDELALGADSDGTIVGEILGAIETDKAIDAHGFGGVGVGAESMMEGEGLAAEASDAIGDGAEGDHEVAGEGPLAHAGGE